MWPVPWRTAEGPNSGASSDFRILRPFWYESTGKNVGLFISWYPEVYKEWVKVGERGLKSKSSDAEIRYIWEAPGLMHNNDWLKKQPEISKSWPKRESNSCWRFCLVFLINVVLLIPVTWMQSSSQTKFSPLFREQSKNQYESFIIFKRKSILMLLSFTSGYYLKCRVIFQIKTRLSCGTNYSWALSTFLPLVFQFSSVQSLSHVQLCNPMDFSTPGFPVHHQLLEPTQTHVHRVSDAMQPSHPLSSPSPAFNLSQHQSIFQSLVFRRL